MDHAIDKPPTQRRQRGTLAIVCLATMILCLDIAVANADFRGARSTLLFGEFVAELAAAPPGHGGVGEVG